MFDRKPSAYIYKWKKFLEMMNGTPKSAIEATAVMVLKPRFFF